MKVWKLAFIAGIAGFLHGMTLTENPLHSCQRIALTMTHPVSGWSAVMRRCSNTALEKYVSAVTNYVKPRAAIHLTPPPVGWSEASGRGTLEEPINRLAQSIRTLKGQSATPGTHLAAGLLSVDVKNVSLLTLLENLGKYCGIEIMDIHGVSNKVISARLLNVPLADGIRQLMRIAGVANYALSYRNDSESQWAVSKIILLPGREQQSEPHRLEKGITEADMRPLDEFPEQLRNRVLDEFPDELLEELPNELLAALRRWKSSEEE